VRRKIAADNSCMFNAVGYCMHGSTSKASWLRSVVAQEVSGDPAAYRCGEGGRGGSGAALAVRPCGPHLRLQCAAAHAAPTPTPTPNPNPAPAPAPAPAAAPRSWAWPTLRTAHGSCSPRTGAAASRCAPACPA
jgi:hypothetical protein